MSPPFEQTKLGAGYQDNQCVYFLADRCHLSLVTPHSILVLKFMTLDIVNIFTRLGNRIYSPFSKFKCSKTFEVSIWAERDEYLLFSCNNSGRRALGNNLSIAFGHVPRFPSRRKHRPCGVERLQQISITMEITLSHACIWWVNKPTASPVWLERVKKVFLSSPSGKIR